MTLSGTAFAASTSPQTVRLKFYLASMAVTSTSIAMLGHANWLTTRNVEAGIGLSAVSTIASRTGAITGLSGFRRMATRLMDGTAFLTSSTPLAFKLWGEEGRSSHVLAGMRETGDNTCCDSIAAHNHNNRHGRSGKFGRDAAGLSQTRPRSAPGSAVRIARTPGYGRRSFHGCRDPVHSSCVLALTLTGARTPCQNRPTTRRQGGSLATSSA